MRIINKIIMSVGETKIKIIKIEISGLNSKAKEMRIMCLVHIYKTVDTHQAVV